MSSKTARFLRWCSLLVLRCRDFLYSLRSSLDLLDHEKSLENSLLILSLDFFLKIFLDLKLVEDHTGDVTGLIMNLAPVKSILKLNEAFHLHVECLDLQVHLEVEIWDVTLLNQLYNIDVVLNASLQGNYVIFEFLLLYLCHISLLQSLLAKSCRKWPLTKN